MRTRFLILFVLLASHLSAQAQLGRKWDARFGGVSHESSKKIFRMSDGGYVMGGISDSGQDGDKTSPQKGYGDYYIVRTDSIGNKLWDKSYGGAGSEIMFSMCVTADGGFLLAGHTGSGADGDKTQPSQGSSDYWVVRLDPQGNKLWDRRYGGSGPEVLMDARPCADGGFILTGYSSSNAGGDKSEDNGFWENGWVVRIDSLGNKVWDETYKSANYLQLWAGLELPDGGFLFGGSASPDSTYDISEYGHGGFGTWLVRTDAQGTIQWDKRYYGGGLDFMEPADDGGFILLAGRTIRIDSVGNELWTKSYGAGGHATGISTTVDGGFLLSEYTAIGAPNEDKTEFNFGWTQTWVLKMDSNGNKIWDKTIFTTETNGGYAIECTPGCIVVGTSCRGGIGGYKTQPNWDGSLVTADFWLVELCEGYIDTTLCPQQPCVGVGEVGSVGASIYPNPTNGLLNIELPNAAMADFSLHNLLGQQVFTTPLTAPSTTLDIDLPDGIYIYRIETGGQMQTGKLVVE